MDPIAPFLTACCAFAGAPRLASARGAVAGLVTINEREEISIEAEACRSPSTSITMSKGQKRSNREIKKPKQPKSGKKPAA